MEIQRINPENKLCRNPSYWLTPYAGCWRLKWRVFFQFCNLAKLTIITRKFSQIGDISYVKIEIFMNTSIFLLHAGTRPFFFV